MNWLNLSLGYDEKIKTQVRIDEIKFKLEGLTTIKNHKRFFDESLGLVEEISNLKEECVSKKMELQSLESTISMTNDASVKMKGFIDFAEIVQDTLRMLEIISHSFGSYKNWIYNSRILPTLVEYI